MYLSWDHLPETDGILGIAVTLHCFWWLMTHCRKIPVYTIHENKIVCYSLLQLIFKQNFNRCDNFTKMLSKQEQPTDKSNLAHVQPFGIILVCFHYQETLYQCHC